LAPEFSYPHPIDDCYEVTKYVFDHKNQFTNNSNNVPIIIAGDSAGLFIEI
jgi:acetyl esterase